jgi:hypothetical protein
MITPEVMDIFGAIGFLILLFIGISFSAPTSQYTIPSAPILQRHICYFKTILAV